MLKIIDTQKTIKNNTLVVTVFVGKRKWATDNIETISTDYVKDVLCAEFEIESLINSPKHPVGNTNRKGIQTSGTWNFILKTKPVVEKEEKATTRKRKTTTTTRKKSNSIRNRMSKIANDS